MSPTFRWVGEDELDRVAECRVRCYAPAAKELTRYQELIREDRRAVPGDFLLAERDGRAVGTTTSLSMNMWVRGAKMPCQGVAWVGTVRSARRGGAFGDANGSGIASQLMFKTLDKARERGQVVSALMPFRVSFYEHFGYGIVERRAEWTIPSAALPSGSCAGLRYMDPDDLEPVIHLRQRVTEHGRCDIETVPAEWTRRRRQGEGGFEFVDRADDTGAARGFMFLNEHDVGGRRYVRVVANEFEDTNALLRQLRMLGSLKDQFGGATMTLPVDVPLNYLLREAQVPHRPVEHAAPGLVVYTRMQMRVLDHERFFEGQSLPTEVRHVSGRATIAVRETEGTTSKFRLEIEGGKLRAAKTDATPDVECTDVRWASIASGDLRGSTAARMGLIDVKRDGALDVLDALGAGAAPWCNEYF